MRYVLPLSERIVGLDPATGNPATAIVLGLGSDKISIRIGASAPPALSLAALGISGTDLLENVPVGTVVATLTGMTAGSSLALTGTSSGAFALSGSNIVTAAAIDREALAARPISVTETLAGASNSPRTTSYVINITDVPAPSAAGGIADRTLTQGSAIATINCATDFIVPAGSGAATYALAPSSAVLPAGLTLNAGTGQITGTPTTVAAAVAIVIRCSTVEGFADSGFQIAVQAAAGQTSITLNGVTFSTTTATQAGYYADGIPWIVAPVGGIAINEPTPAASIVAGGVAGGTQINPQFQGVQGYDQRLANWSAAAQVTAWPRSVVPGDVIVKAVPYLPAPANLRAGIMQEWGVCHVVAAAPAAGAYSPAAVGWAARGTPAAYTPNLSAAVAALPSYDTTAHNKPSKTKILAMIGRPIPTVLSQCHNANDDGYQAAMPYGTGDFTGATNYGELLEYFGHAALYLLSEAALVDKLDVARWLYMHGRDWYEGFKATNTFWRGNGGHYQFQFQAVLWFLHVEGRTADIDALKSTLAGNPLDQAIQIDAAYVAGLAPHNSPTEPFVSRRRLITAISGNNITVKGYGDGGAFDADPAQIDMTTMLLTPTAGGSGVAVTAMPNGSNVGGGPDWTVTVTSAAGFAVGQEVYFVAPFAIAVGDYHWQIMRGAVAGARSSFNPAPLAKYRDINHFSDEAIFAQALYPGRAVFANLIGYATRANAANTPAGFDYPDAHQRRGSFLWYADFWNAHWVALSTPAPVYDFELVDNGGASTFTSVSALRVSISNGPWQTLAAAGLTLARDPADPKALVVSGFADNAAALSARWHYEQQFPDEPYLPGQVAPLWYRRVGGPAPVNPGQPGLTVSQTPFPNPVSTT